MNVGFKGPFRKERNTPIDCPLAAIIDITLVHKNKSKTYSALLDTGSPISSISAKAFQFLQPQRSGKKKLLVASDAIAAKKNEGGYTIYRIDELHFAGRVYTNHPYTP